jgi:malonate transporter MadL subunit
MAIFGSAILAACYLAGIYLGDLLGSSLGVKANVGGVGIAMLLLILCLHYLRKSGRMTADFEHGVERGITFWAMIYVPVVVAMAATQNVVVAAKSGPMALVAAFITVGVCILIIAGINRFILPKNTHPDWATRKTGDVE